MSELTEKWAAKREQNRLKNAHLYLTREEKIEKEFQRMQKIKNIIWDGDARRHAADTKTGGQMIQEGGMDEADYLKQRGGDI